MDFLEKQVELPTLMDCHFKVLRATKMCFTFFETSDPVKSHVKKSSSWQHVWGIQFPNEGPPFSYFNWAQGNSDSLSLFEDSHMPGHSTNIFLLWINVNRLCLHVGLEFWTIFSFTYSESTSFTTWQFRFTTLYLIHYFL